MKEIRRNSYRVALVGFAFVALLVASACGDGKEADEGHYENTELGFAFDYPDEWQLTRESGSFEIAVAEPEETVASIIVGEPRSGQLHGMLVQVNVNNLETEREISEAILGLDDLFAQAFAQVAGSEVRETDSAELAGMPARRYLIDFEFEGSVPSTSEQLIAPTPGLTFQLFCEAPRDRFAEIRTGCQMVIDSFEFTSSPQGQPAATAAPTEGATSTPDAPATGKIAFRSERDGNNEIYIMNADGSELTNLTNNPAWDAGPNWSPDGAQIAFLSDRDGNNEIYVMNADGSGLARLTTEGAIWSAWSPDGSRIAFASVRDGNSEVYVMNADGSEVTRLTDNPAIDGQPAWSPDGSRIAFFSDRDGNNEIYVMNADGSGVTRLTDNPADDLVPFWSPDGAQIAFRSRRDGDVEIYVMNADGSDPTRLSIGGAFATSWSPGGSHIAFTSDRDGNFEIYVMNADGTGVTRLTDNPAFDLNPAWSPVP